LAHLLSVHSLSAGACFSAITAALASCKQNFSLDAMRQYDWPIDYDCFDITRRYFISFTRLVTRQMTPPSTSKAPQPFSIPPRSMAGPARLAIYAVLGDYER
jgi:hypothetical protein